MSIDVRKYAPIITEKLDFASTDTYLLKHGVISVADYDGCCKALQSGSTTNAILVRQMLSKILGKPREFYRALRDHVNGKFEDVHPSNNELFYSLPVNFVSV